MSLPLPSLSFISYCMYRLVPGIYCTLYQFHCIYPIHRDRGFIVLPGPEVSCVVSCLRLEPALLSNTSTGSQLAITGNGYVISPIISPTSAGLNLFEFQLL